MHEGERPIYLESVFGWEEVMAKRVSRISSRISKARAIVRALLETLSYVGEARVHPPLPALPAPKNAR
jgi:hypothetical protein